MRNPLAHLSQEERERLLPRPQPNWVDPMLATLTDHVFSDPGWIFERKLDGERCLVFRSGGEIRLLSRNRKDIGISYPELVEAAQKTDAPDLVSDGEIVAFEGGNTSFSRLQRRMQVKDPEKARRTGVSVYLYLFDLIHVDGYDVTGLALRDRKAILRRALIYDDPLRFTPHRNGGGEAYHREACHKGWEGVIAKDASSPYVGGRSRSWLKMKCVNEQEFVIGGYTDPQGSRTGFGALLVGYFEAGRLVYAGKVGTGFDQETLDGLHRLLRSLEQTDSPFSGEVPSPAHWVRPELVAQVGFTEWTRDGKLRHPRFLGLRRDKPAREVVRERPV